MADRLEALLTEARQDGARSGDVKRLGRALGLSAGATATATKAAAAAKVVSIGVKAATTAGTSAGLSTAAKITIGTALATAVALGSFAGMAEPTATGTPAEPQHRATVAPVMHSEPEPEVEPLATDEPTEEALLETAEDPSISQRTPRRRRPELSEPALLDRARALLRRSPRRALGLCRQHARRFPSGQFQEEREVLMIDALARLGQSGQAEGRAARFAESHPRSIHRRRVDAILGRGGIPIASPPSPGE